MELFDLEKENEKLAIEYDRMFGAGKSDSI
jgi:hypothetical protein